MKDQTSLYSNPASGFSYSNGTLPSKPKDMKTLIEEIHTNQIKSLRKTIEDSGIKHSSSVNSLEYDLADLYKLIDIWRKETLQSYGLED